MKYLLLALVLISCTKPEKAEMYKFGKDFYITYDKHQDFRLVYFTCGNWDDKEKVDKIINSDNLELLVIDGDKVNVYKLEKELYYTFYIIEALERFKLERKDYEIYLR
jgi:hypothetical protein